MREHRDQLALVWLASVSHHKNTSFRLWTRLTPGRGPILSHRDQSLGNWCLISSWGKQMKTHSIKLALESSLYFKVGRSRNLSSWPRWGCFPCLSLCCGCSHPMHETEHRDWCCTDIPCARTGRNSHWDYSTQLHFSTQPAFLPRGALPTASWGPTCHNKLFCHLL